jgi:hypothetical protein
MGEKQAKNKSFLFAPRGRPRTGSHEDVIKHRLSGLTAKETSELTHYSVRHVQEITGGFAESVLPKLLQLHREGYEPGVIAGEVGMAEATVVLAIDRFGRAAA